MGKGDSNEEWDLIFHSSSRLSHIRLLLRFIIELAVIFYMSDATAGLKESRERCYQSRDEYFKCCEEYKAYSESKCRKLKEKFEKNCPASWIPHFIRKHNYEKYRQKLVEEGVLLTEVDINGNRLFHMTYNVLASSIVRRNADVCSKQNSSPKFPKTDAEKLAHCGCINDALHDVSVEQFCERMKIFGSMKYLDTLRILKDVRYLKTGRLLLRHLCSSSSSLPPYIVLEMIRMLVCIYMEDANEKSDEELYRELFLLANKVPYFLKPTIMLLLKSCYPVNSMPKLPANLILRPVVITALLVLAFYTNSHLTVSSTYLQYLSRRSVALLGDDMWHFNSVIRQSKYWNIKNTTVSDDGNCCICGEKFKKNEDLSKMEFNLLRDEIKKYLSDDMQIFSSATDQEISNLRKHIKRRINSLEKSLDIFANVLLIVRKGGDTNRVWSKHDKFSNSRLSNDDLFVLLAVMELGINAYFLTNDFFINHRNMLTPYGQSLFDKWVERRAVRLDNRNIIMPSKFAPYTHGTENGYHIPVKTVNKSVALYSFLCVQRKHKCCIEAKEFGRTKIIAIRKYNEYSRSCPTIHIGDDQVGRSGHESDDQRRLMCLCTKRYDAKEVYLFERIDSIARANQASEMYNILRPTDENIHLLIEELRFRSMANFCNIISKTDVKALAEADDQKRYQKSNKDSKMLAEEVAKAIAREESLFENAKTDTILLIIDRSEDPVTPLLNQWTYEAMVHELLGINNHRVNINMAPNSGTLILSPLHDPFYSKNMYANFGEIGQNIKELITEFQRKSQTNQKLESVADMKNFVEQYPQFKKISGTVTKHLTILGELSKLVSTRNLLEISEVEQQLVSGGEHSHCLAAIRRLYSMNRRRIL
ncbi:Vacuolar protein sorting-associated protein 45 [Dirofilaria immitis]|nr:Vacuolar protein sorting-associated protein 45 [Dirofilaria immitis]